MSKHIVKCKLCSLQFDADKEEHFKENRRYIHKKCYEKQQMQMSEEEKSYEALIQYIKQKFNLSTVTVKITKQITSYKKEYGYTYSGILKALVWWFDVKGNTLEKTNGGIGIIPWIYGDAKSYYYGLFLAQELNKNKNLGNYKVKVREVEIPPPRAYTPPPKLFNLLGKDEENE